MFKVFVPDFVYSDIYQIDPKDLKKKGIKAVCIDLDGTMASRHAPNPTETVKPFLQSFIDNGIKVLVLSNNKQARVSLFCEDLPVKFLSKARKPFKRAFKQAAEVIGEKMSDIAIIGDQIYTDTFGGNRAGATTVYVESIDKKDFFINLRFQFERGFVYLRKRNQK